MSWAGQLEIMLLEFRLGIVFPFLSALTTNRRSSAVILYPDMDEIKQCLKKAATGEVLPNNRVIVPLGHTQHHFLAPVRVRVDRSVISNTVFIEDSVDDADSDVDADTPDVGPAPVERVVAFKPDLTLSFQSLEEVRVYIRKVKTEQLNDLRIESSDKNRVIVVCRGCEKTANGKHPACIIYKYNGMTGLFELEIESVLVHNCPNAGKSARFDYRTPTELYDEIANIEFSPNGITASCVVTALRARNISVSHSKARRVAAIAMQKRFGSSANPARGSAPNERRKRSVGEGGQQRCSLCS